MARRDEILYSERVRSDHGTRDYDFSRKSIEQLLDSGYRMTQKALAP